MTDYTTLLAQLVEHFLGPLVPAMHNRISYAKVHELFQTCYSEWGIYDIYMEGEGGIREKRVKTLPVLRHAKLYYLITLRSPRYQGSLSSFLQCKSCKYQSVKKYSLTVLRFQFQKADYWDLKKVVDRERRLILTGIKKTIHPLKSLKSHS